MNPELRRRLWTVDPFKHQLFSRCYAAAIYPWAWVWRRFLGNTEFLTITGSLGKSTARECLTAVLASRYRVRRNMAGDSRYGIPRVVRQTRRSDEYVVVEVNGSKPAWLDRALRLLKPKIAVVISILPVHMDVFRDLEHIAETKQKVVDAVAPGGTVVLSADDPLVARMATGCAAKVFTFGRESGSDLWADEVNATWPQRLAFRAHYGGQACNVKTQLVGGHHLHSALATIATAICCGFDLRSAAEALSEAPPHTSRLEPVELPSGAVVLRDEIINPRVKFEAALKTVASARVKRRIVACGLMSDAGMGSSAAARFVGAAVAKAADMAVFLGEGAKAMAKSAASAGMSPDAIHSFSDLAEAAEFLRGELQEGDLVYLTGRLYEHVARVYFAQLGTVGCSRKRCKLPMLCDSCVHLDFRAESAGQ